MKIRKRFVFALIIVLVLGLLFTKYKPDTSFVENYEGQYSEKSIIEKLIVSSQKLGDTNAGYAFIGTGEKQPIVFVHGTPGSWSAFQYIMGSVKLQKSFDMLSVDRLGWGHSPVFGEGIETDFEKQAEHIFKVSNHMFPDKKPILVGHSLGGSIVPKVAMKYPDSFSGVVILAGSINPELGEPRWYNHLSDSWVMKMILPKMLQRSNVEIMSLEENLKQMEASWKDLEVPVTIIQGTSDSLVSPKNGDYGKDKLAHLGDKFNLIEIKGGNHFLIWKNIDVIENELLKIKDLLSN